MIEAFLGGFVGKMLTCANVLYYFSAVSTVRDNSGDRSLKNSSRLRNKNQMVGSSGSEIKKNKRPLDQLGSLVKVSNKKAASGNIGKVKDESKASNSKESEKDSVPALASLVGYSDSDSDTGSSE